MPDHLEPEIPRLVEMSNMVEMVEVGERAGRPVAPSSL
jgi:hypothetical protein